MSAGLKKEVSDQRLRHLTTGEETGASWRGVNSPVLFSMSLSPAQSSSICKTCIATHLQTALRSREVLCLRGMPLFHPKGHTCLEKLISWFLLIPTALWTTSWVSPTKSTDCRGITPKKGENTGGGRDWNEARMHLAFLNLMKNPVAVVMQLGEKFAWSLCFSNHPSVPKNTVTCQY